MNINHINTDELIIPDDIWGAIWEEQKKLHEQYKSVEIANNLGYALVKNRPFNLNDRNWQYYLKDLAYRVIEELAEAQEAKDLNQEVHCIEEEIDALHFLVELNVVIKQSLVINSYSPYNPVISYWPIVYNLGLAGNCLKIKPWKQDPQLTDTTKYRAYINRATSELMETLRLNLSDKEIYKIYMKKNKVNQFRLRSKY